MNSSHKYEEAMHNMKKYGVLVDNVRFDWEAMQSQKAKSVSGLCGGIEHLFKKNKTDYVKGYGKFTGPNDIEVDLIDGGKQSINAKNIIIATGSEPSPLPGNVIPIDE